MRPRVILHVGPHKTGTTSIQFALMAGDSFAYPPPGMFGPGHAHIAWRALGINGFPAEAGLLVDLVQAANSPGPVVFSSEEFSKAFVLGSTPESIERLTEEFPVELVITLTPLADRLMSEAQELIKHRACLDLASVADLLEVLNSQPGLSPNFLSRFVNMAKWSKIHFVVVNKQNPNFLIGAFSEIIGVRLKEDQDTRSNSRTPYAQVLIMSALNGLLPNSDMMLLRKAAQKAFQIAANELPQLREVKYPTPPPEIGGVLDRIWSEQRAYIAALVGAGRASLFE